LIGEYVGFIRKMFRNVKTIIFIIIIFGISVIPFVGMYFDNLQQIYSYHPLGIHYQNKEYLLFCAIYNGGY